MGRVNGDTCDNNAECASLNCVQGSCAAPPGAMTSKSRLKQGAIRVLGADAAVGPLPDGSPCTKHQDCQQTAACVYVGDNGDAECHAPPGFLCGKSPIIDVTRYLCCGDPVGEQNGTPGALAWQCGSRDGVGGTCGGGKPCYNTCGSTPCQCPLTGLDGRAALDNNGNPETPMAGIGAGCSDAGTGAPDAALADASTTACCLTCAAKSYECISAAGSALSACLAPCAAAADGGSNPQCTQPCFKSCQSSMASCASSEGSCKTACGQSCPADPPTTNPCP